MRTTGPFDVYLRATPFALSLSFTAALAGVFAPTAAYAQAQPARRARLTATLEALTGAVELSPADPSSPTGHARAHRAAQPGEALDPGARLRVPDDEAASARVRFSNGGAMQVEHHSTLHMFGPAAPLPAGAPPSTDTTLARGRVRFVLAPPALPAGSPAPHVPLSTHAAMVTLGAGEAVVTVDAGRVTRVMALRGRARVRVLGREFVVREGQGFRAEFGRPPLPPAPLPPAPTWTSRFAARTLVAPGRTASLRATFAPAVPGGPRGRPVRPLAGPGAPRPVHRYRLQLARDAAFSDLVFDRLVEPHESTFATGDLPPGVYRARTAVVDADRMEGVFSETTEFSVIAPRVTAGAPGRRASVELPAGFFCGLDGAPLQGVSAPIPLAAARNHRLRCATRADGAGAIDLEIAALQAGPLVHAVRMEPSGFDASGGMRVLVLHLHDAAGAPVAYADIAVRAQPSSVSVDPVSEAEERGVYTSRVTWPRGVTGMRLSFTVNGAERFDFEQGDAPPPAP